MSLALVTAVIGNYDPIKELPDLTGVDDPVFVTDDRDLVVPGWRMHYWSQPWLSPREQAKLPKCRPDLFTGCDTSLWIDGSQRVVNGDFTGIEELLGRNDLAICGHELRTCVFDELRHSIPHPYYYGQPVAEQGEYYAQMGMPQEFGLWETAFILRRHTTAIAMFGSAWLAEQHTWSLQDQLSLPFLLWSAGLPITTIPGTQYETPWTRFEGHA